MGALGTSSDHPSMPRTMATISPPPTSAPTLVPGFWVETAQRQRLPHRITLVASRWWERLNRLAEYEIITCPASDGLAYAELRIRYLTRTDGLRFSLYRRRYAALCGGAAGVARFLSELRHQGIPLPKRRIDQVKQAIESSAATERWPGLLMEAVRG
jgi:hypothetical protein